MYKCASCVPSRHHVGKYWVSRACAKRLVSLDFNRSPLSLESLEKHEYIACKMLPQLLLHTHTYVSTRGYHLPLLGRDPGAEGGLVGSARPFSLHKDWNSGSTSSGWSLINWTIGQNC
eukprot:3277232-Amphidinium_carterae.1